MLILSLNLFLISLSLNAQELATKGKITSKVNGDIVEGAAINIKGSSIGTTSDQNGEFTLTISQGSTLIISMAGYKPVEIIINDQPSIAIELENEIGSEMIATGYGLTKKKDVTSAIANVKPEEFNKGIINGADQLIEGKIAGVQIYNNGEPGEGSTIQIRGTSINDVTPLVVVDGIPLTENNYLAGGRNFLSLINPSDIQDITVLKDAAAASIYGMRGAKGVILITTKSGTPGKLKINYSGYYGLSFIKQKPDFLSPSEFRTIISQKAPQMLSELGDANTDWIKEVTQVGQSMQHTISLSGGRNKTTYFGSVHYFQNEGVLRFTENKKLNLLLNVNQKILNDDLTLALNLKNTFTRDLFGPNVLETAAAFDPTQPVRNSNGDYFQWPNSIAPRNPVATQELTDNQGENFRTLSNLSLNYEVPLVKGLHVKTNIAYDYAIGNYDHVSNIAGDNAFSVEQTKESILFEFLTNYQNTFQKHTVDAVAGYAWQNFNNTVSDNTNSTNENRLISFFGRMKYDYANKYLLTASLRRDGSSNFNNEWGLFPSVAIGWRILKEHFASGLTKSMTELKVRASYGVTGLNNQIFQLGAIDPDIKWEEMTSVNIGMDAGFLKGRLMTSIDFYSKDDKDIILPVDVPSGNIPTRVLTNIGEINNKGVELTLHSVAIDRPNFKWNLALNTSYNKNQIIKLDNLSGAALQNFPGYPTGSIEGNIGQTIQLTKVGESLGAFYTYIHKRNGDGSLVTDPNGDGIQSNIEMYKDLNKDGVINQSDKKIYKKSTPDVIIGITSDMVYKKWDLSFSIKGLFGNYVYNNIASANGNYQRLTQGGIPNNIHKSALETEFKSMQLFSNYYVQNASFVKFTNITLGYRFNKFSFGSIRTYATAQNALTLTQYKGMDPEIYNGIDNNQYPRSITVSIGISLTFDKQESSMAK